MKEFINALLVMVSKPSIKLPLSLLEVRARLINRDLNIDIYREPQASNRISKTTVSSPKLGQFVH